MKRPPVTVGLLVAGFIFATAADNKLHSQELYTAADSAYYNSAFDYPDFELIKRRAAEFEAARNSEIETSLAAYAANRQRLFEEARNAEIDAAIAATNARREADFAEARNAEIERSVLVYRREREAVALFSATRNAEIELSVAMVKYRREQEAAFEAARNAEIEASIASSKARREEEFAAARNAEIEASIALSKARITEERDFAAARNAEVEASLRTYEAQRAASFEDERNAEINRSLVAYHARRDYEATIASLNANRSVEHLPSTSYRIAIPEPVCPLAIGNAGVIQFGRSSSSFEPTEAEVLARIIDLAQACPHLTIEIRGHTDSSGSDRANQKLSERRAELAAEHLLIAGIEGERISVIGLGARAPLAPNNNADNRARNRRIEIAFRRKGTAPVLAADSGRID